jgi:hypothetical protein
MTPTKWVLGAAVAASYAVLIIWMTVIALKGQPG